VTNPGKGPTPKVKNRKGSRERRQKGAKNESENQLQETFEKCKKVKLTAKSEILPNEY